MALDQSALLEVLEALKAADVTCTDTRTDTRTGLRNGHRLRTLTTAAGGPERRIPKVAGGLVLSVAAGTASPGRSGVVRGGDGPVAPARAGAAGLGELLPARTSKATFDYLRHYAWRRVII